MKGTETTHLYAFRSSRLKDGEEIVGYLKGWIGEVLGTGDKTQRHGQFILTNMRVCFYRKGVFGEVLETIPLEKITSVETLSRLGYRVLRLHTSNDELAFKTFERRGVFDEVYESLEATRDSLKAASDANPTAVSIPEQIKQLAELRDAGVLTDEEFTTKKAELLQRM